jgi:hypothetical protein
VRFRAASLRSNRGDHALDFWVRFVRAGLLTVAGYRGGSIDRLRASSADDSPLPEGSIGVVPRGGPIDSTLCSTAKSLTVA